VNPRIGINLSHRQELRLLQSPQMIQAMQILQQPLMELKERIDQELQENVFLEIKEPGPGEGEAEERREAMLQEERGEPDLGEPVSALFETLEELEKRSVDYRPSPGARKGGDEGEDAKHEALQNTAVSGVTLAEHLLEQLAMLDLTPTMRRLVELVIYNLDDNGRLMVSPEEIAREAGGEVSREQAEEAIRIVQAMDPPGVAARDLKECLLLQLDRLDGDHTLLRSLIQDHLEDILMNRLPKVSRQTGKSLEEVKDALEFLRHLNPKPGAEFGRDVNYTVVPDVIVEEVDGRYEIQVVRDPLPSLQISPVYKKLLKEAKKDKKVYEYLKKKIETARAFMDAIQQRQSTLHRICRFLVDKQREFLEQGVEKLKPLKMQEVADALGVHISTVSRAISGKYMQTPRGIFELRRFFSTGTTGQDGKELSQNTIKEWVREIVEAEDKKNPLSDDEIVEKLRKEKGVKLARRTVTKYRKALGIPSSRLRKAY